MTAPVLPDRHAGSDRQIKRSFTRRAGNAALNVVDRRPAPFFLAPALIGIVLIDGIPLVYGLAISLFNQSLSNQNTSFVGLHNYAVQLSNPSTWHSIGLSLIFTGFSVAFAFLLGIISALLLNAPMRGRGAIRAILIIPWAIPAFVAALIWQWMYNDQFGIIDSVLSTMGVQNPPIWLSAQHAMLSLIIVMVWKSFPFQMLLLLAGLQAIPDELYEAAKTDGASAWKRFTSITLPLLQPISFIAILMAAINAFQFFPIPWILTAGGPADATNVIPISSYNTAFQAGQISQGATIATIMFIIILVGASLYLWRYVKQIGSL